MRLLSFKLMFKSVVMLPENKDRVRVLSLILEMMHLCVFCMDDSLHPFVCYLVTQMQKFMFSIICIVLSGGIWN